MQFFSSHAHQTSKLKRQDVLANNDADDSPRPPNPASKVIKTHIAHFGKPVHGCVIFLQKRFMIKTMLVRRKQRTLSN